MTDTIIPIPLNKLLAWEGNVRKTESDKGIDELAASIAAHGLLQSLVVRSHKRGTYAVVAGQRRLLALKNLADAGTIERHRPIPCAVLPDDANATEISLAENVQREAMHPADEFDAFKALIDKGVPVADIAARFGVTDKVVQKRLKLANVSPALLQLYRQGAMTLQHVMAFAVTDDHAAQETVWQQAPKRRKDPDAIREQLTEREITARDKRVRFVTLKTYQKAGGVVTRDLFSDDVDGLFIKDIALLDQLVAAKLEKAAKALRKEGWKWVETAADFDYDARSQYERRYPEPLPLPPKQAEELNALTTEAEELSEIDDLDAGQQERYEQISERIDILQDRATTWPPETLAIAGVVVTIGQDSQVALHYGLIKPEDMPKTKASKPQGDEQRERSIPASVVESLTAERSAALNAAMIDRPDIALATVVHSFAAAIFYGGRATGATSLEVRAEAQSLRRVDGSKASASIALAGDQWAALIPGSADELFPWCLEQPQERLLSLLAFCAAQTVNAVQLKHEQHDCKRLTHAAQLATALQIDMTQWFTPTAVNYFSRVGKDRIIAALQEVKGSAAPAWNSMKKTELASLAEREIASTGWLPEPLRCSPVSAEPAEQQT